MGKGYNNYMTKKFFHPGSKENIKRVWMAQQKHEFETKKQEELQAQYEREQDMYGNRALLGDEKARVGLSFMYDPPPGAKQAHEKEEDEPEYKFEWQRKYNAPRESFAKDDEFIRDQPFGIEVRNVRCIKCHKWGHVNTDRVCPLFGKSITVEPPEPGMNPSKLVEDMREDGLAFTKKVLGKQVDTREERNQLVQDDDEDPEVEFLKSLSSKQKKKLLKKLEKLEKKEKKKNKKHKKKKEEAKQSDSESEEDEKERRHSRKSEEHSKKSSTKHRRHSSESKGRSTDEHQSRKSDHHESSHRRSDSHSAKRHRSRSPLQNNRTDRRYERTERPNERIERHNSRQLNERGRERQLNEDRSQQDNYENLRLKNVRDNHDDKTQSRRRQSRHDSSSSSSSSDSDSSSHSDNKSRKVTASSSQSRRERSAEPRPRSDRKESGRYDRDCSPDRRQSRASDREDRRRSPDSRRYSGNSSHRDRR